MSEGRLLVLIVAVAFIVWLLLLPLLD